MVSFILGGSGSGKSEYAENLAVRLKNKEEEGHFLKSTDVLSHIQKPHLVYLATMQPQDNESRLRVTRHQKMRAGKGFETRECYTHIEQLSIQENEILLLECLSNLMANEMFSPEGRTMQATGIVKEGICRLAECSRHLVVVGNNVFEDGMEYEQSTRNYLQEMAKVHQFLGEYADQVVEVVCGIPVEWRKV